MLPLRGFILKARERPEAPLKNGTRDFENSPHLKDRYSFMRQSVEILNIFDTSTFKQVFWWTKTFLKKTGVPFFSSVHYSWKCTISLRNCLVKSQC